MNIFKVAFLNQGQVFEIYAKSVRQGELYGFVEVEDLVFGQHQGLDMDKVVDVVSSGAAGNWFVEHRGRSMCSGRFDPGFRVALHHKDLKICQAMMEADHVQLPMVEMTLVHYERLMADGYGDEDISALYRIKRPLFGDEV